MLFVSCVILLCLIFPFAYVLLEMCLIELYINDFLCHVLFLIMLFKRSTKQTRLVGLNKILISSMSLNFIDIVFIQIKDTLELNRLFHWRRINIS